MAYWICGKCGEEHHDAYVVCWKCSLPRSDQAKSDQANAGAMRVIDGCGCVLLLGLGLFIMGTLLLETAFGWRSKLHGWVEPASVIVVASWFLMVKWLRAGKRK